jgi:hypothetical protein
MVHLDLLTARGQLTRQIEHGTAWYYLAPETTPSSRDAVPELASRPTTPPPPPNGH